MLPFHTTFRFLPSLRTPLTVICGYLETLLDNVDEINPRWSRALESAGMLGLVGILGERLRQPPGRAIALGGECCQCVGFGSLTAARRRRGNDGGELFQPVGCTGPLRHPGEGRDPVSLGRSEAKSLDPGLRRDDGRGACVRLMGTPSIDISTSPC